MCLVGAGLRFLDLSEIQSLSNLQQLAVALGSELHSLKLYMEPTSWITKHPVVAGWEGTPNLR